MLSLGSHDVGEGEKDISPNRNYTPTNIKNLV